MADIENEILMFCWPCILANDQIDAQIFKTLIRILYMYMFWAISCSSSEGEVVLTRHLVSSLSVSDRSVHTLRNNWSDDSSDQLFLNLCTERSLTESDDTRCRVNTTSPSEDEQDIAQNMYM